MIRISSYFCIHEWGWYLNNSGFLSQPNKPGMGAIAKVRSRDSITVGIPVSRTPAPAPERMYFQEGYFLEMTSSSYQSISTIVLLHC